MKNKLLYKNMKKLAKVFLMSSIFVYPQTTLAYSLSGNINSMTRDGNSCTVITSSGSFFRSKNAISNKKYICDFLELAKHFNNKVYINGKIDHSDGDDNLKILEVNFLNRAAYWFNGNKGNDSDYYLKGFVEDVYYNDNGRCYVAINENKHTSKYDKTYHETENKNICAFATSAFYLSEKVKMHAIVDKTENDYANNIDKLSIDDTCS